MSECEFAAKRTKAVGYCFRDVASRVADDPQTEVEFAGRFNDPRDTLRPLGLRPAGRGLWKSGLMSEQVGYRDRGLVCPAGLLQSQSTGNPRSMRMRRTSARTPSTIAEFRAIAMN